MERLLIAFPGDKARETVKTALESGGFVVRSAPRTAAEVLRLVRFMGGGIVVCAYMLPDMTAAQLCEDLSGDAFLLVLGTPEQLENMARENAFTLPLPFSRSALLAAVRMIAQMQDKQLLYLLPKKKAEETRMIERAKALLTREKGMTEDGAHRALQALSMSRGEKTAVVAALIIKELEHGEAD